MSRNQNLDDYDPNQSNGQSQRNNFFDRNRGGGFRGGFRGGFGGREGGIRGENDNRGGYRVGMDNRGRFNNRGGGGFGGRDGFGAKIFHEKCNYKGETLTIIQSKDEYIFGGY